jgi:hypothetical protein
MKVKLFLPALIEAECGNYRTTVNVSVALTMDGGVDTESTRSGFCGPSL